MNAGRPLEIGPLRFSMLRAGFDDNPDGEVVLCLHGFPDNANTFRKQLPAFAEAGYRVVAPTLRGYEPSSLDPDADYSLGTLGRDVIAWLDDLGAERAHLVGHDWGAAIAYVAGALAPERFASLTTIAVPHAARLDEGIRRVPRQFLRSWYMVFFQLRGIADYVVERDDWALVRRLWRTWSPGYTLSDEQWADLRDTFAAPGVKQAMLAYYRQNASPRAMLGLTETEVDAPTTVPVRTLAITGADDGCIDTRLYDIVFDDADFPAGVRVERIAGVGHFAHLERPDLVNRLILDHLDH
ncbi:MAG: alpha/beta fold hydrolase [Actinomycetota bacterium]